MCDFLNMDTPQLRDAYRQYRTMAQAVAPFEYRNEDFLQDVKKEMDYRELNETPVNFVIAAEATARTMALIADEYDNWVEENEAHVGPLDRFEAMGYDTLEERAMDLLDD